jgi:chemotaxis protein CheC
MIIDADQQDAVAELVNIAFARTAAALSDLTQNRVELSVPEVAAHPIEDLETALGKYVSGEVATVHQFFGGPVSGDAFLLLDIDGAAKLVGLLTDASAPTRQMGSSDREVLSEVGNILLNACLGVFGDLLRVRFTFAVPRLQLESLGSMLNSLLIEHDEIRHALLVGTRFAIRSSNVTGCLVLVLGVTSLQQFLAAVEAWAERSVGGDDGL